MSETLTCASENTASKSGSEFICVALIAAATFILSVAMGMCAIIFPLTMEANGISTSLIGLVMSSETIAAIALCFCLPRILHNFGMKNGMLFSTLLRVPALVWLSFTSDFSSWLIAVFANGVGCFTLLVLLQTWVNSIPFKANKGLMVALYSTAISVGLACGPVVLRYSAELSPAIMPLFSTLFSKLGIVLTTDSAALEKQFQFFLAAFISLSAIVPVLMGLFMVPSFEFHGKAKIWKTVMSGKGPMFAVAMGGVSFFGVTAFITLYGLRNHLSVEDSALLLTCFMSGGLVLQAPLTWASDFVDRRYVIVAASFLSMVCAVYLPIAIYVNYQAWILLFFWGGVIGTLYSTALALIGERYDGEDSVAANAGYSLMDAMGGTAGIIAIGFLMDKFGADGLPYVIMFASIVYFSFALTRYKVV